MGVIQLLDHTFKEIEPRTVRASTRADCVKSVDALIIAGSPQFRVLAGSAQGPQSAKLAHFRRECDLHGRPICPRRSRKPSTPLTRYVHAAHTDRGVWTAIDLSPVPSPRRGGVTCQRLIGWRARQQRTHEAPLPL